MLPEAITATAVYSVQRLPLALTASGSPSNKRQKKLNYMNILELVGSLLHSLLPVIVLVELVIVICATITLARHFAPLSWFVSLLLTFFSLSGAYLSLSQIASHSFPRINAIASLIFCGILLVFIYKAAYKESIPRVFTGKRGWLLFYTCSVLLLPVVLTEAVILIRGHIFN